MSRIKLIIVNYSTYHTIIVDRQQRSSRGHVSVKPWASIIFGQVEVNSRAANCRGHNVGDYLLQGDLISAQRVANAADLGETNLDLCGRTRNSISRFD